VDSARLGVTGPHAALPWRFLAALCAARISLYLLTSGPLAYGYMSDEFYYLDCARHLSWGYVDHPPLSIGLLRVVIATLGDSLLALHLLPALAHCATFLLVALLARELGGERTAQRLAALATLVAPVYLGVTDFYSMNAFEPVVWAGAALVVARILNGADPRAWLLLGGILGLGLLNKVSVLWLGVGLALGLVATPERRWLLTPWPWLSGAIAAVLFAPHVLWQLESGWPLLEFMENARNEKMVEQSLLGFAWGQVLGMNPLFAPFWLAGLAHYFGCADGRRYRLLGWIWVGAFVLLAVSGRSRVNYLAPAFAVLLPAGGLVFEHLARRPRVGWLPAAAMAVFALGGLVGAPMAMALLPPERYVAYERVLGLKAPVEQTEELGTLPLHFALRFGWSELRAAVAEAVATLTPAERVRAVVLASWFGDAGMFNHHHSHYGLPPAIAGHNHYWLWGPGEATGDVLIALRPDAEQLDAWFADVRPVAEVDCTHCMPDVDRLNVYVCRKPRRPIAEWWPEVKRYL
jgi:4-amino-4-deoxy-L-arabinose transferase-like glycosyltransferase